MPDLLFFFDSEDYETPAADEGERWWAEALSRHGLTGCFNLVAEEARALRDRGRRDVLRALARHEIGYHSNLHSAHPVHVEYLEEMGWDEGVAAVLAREARGVADVRDLTGQHPATYCKPGSNWAPQVLEAMTLLGIPVFCDAPFEWAPGRPLWYCGSLCVGYHTSFDRYFDVPDRRARMRADLLALLEERERTGGVVVMYTHPCRLMTAAFPSTFTAGQSLPRSAWRPSPLRPRGEVEALMADFDDFLDWVAHASGARVITYRELYRRLQPGPRWLDGAALADLLGQADGPLVPRRLGGFWLSPAEQLGVVLWAAAWRREHGSLPSAVPVRPLLGPDQLAGPVEPREVEVAVLLAAASAASAAASASRRVPAVTRVGDQLVGPAVLLDAVVRALRSEGDRVLIRPRDDLPELARRPDVAGLRFQGTWSVLAPEFEAPRIIQLARLQTWSASPAEPVGPAD